MARRLRALALALALTLPAPGCAALVVTACEPQVLGGTRLLLAGPGPPAHGGAVLCLLWLLDLPLSLAVDLACAPGIIGWLLLRDDAPPEPGPALTPAPPAPAPRAEPELAPGEVTAQTKARAATSVAAGHRRD